MTEYSTAGHVSSSIDVQIVPALGSRKLNSATPSVVEQFLDEHHRRHRPLPVTIRPRTPTARSRNLRTHQPCCRRYTSMMPDDLGGSLCSRLCTASWPGIGPDLGSALGFPGHGNADVRRRAVSGFAPPPGPRRPASSAGVPGTVSSMVRPSTNCAVGAHKQLDHKPEL